METIDLGEKMESGSPVRSNKHEKYYPSVSFSDFGVGGVSSFDDKDIGKVIKIQADIKLTAIESEDRADKKKKFRYRFEVHKIHMPEDLSKQEEYAKIRRKGSKKI